MIKGFVAELFCRFALRTRVNLLPRIRTNPPSNLGITFAYMSFEFARELQKVGYFSRLISRIRKLEHAVGAVIPIYAKCTINFATFVRSG